MKQRLLTLLVMLFASVGMTWAAGEITITTANDAKEDATITLTSTKDIQKADDIAHTGNITIKAETKYPTKTLVFTLPKSKSGTLTKSDADLGNVSVTIDGEVSSFAATEGKLAKVINSLAFTNNGKLSTLTITELTALNTLSCPGNKLSVIPAKGNITNYSVGEQTIDNKISATNVKDDNSKNGVQITFVEGLFASTPNFTFEKVTDCEEKPNTLTVTPLKGDDITTPNTYTFKKGSIFYSGDIKATINILDNTNYPGVKLVTSLNGTIAAPIFTFGKNLIIPEGCGFNATSTTKQNPIEDLSIYRFSVGEEFSVTPKAAAGCTFKGFNASATKGLTSPKSPNGNEYFFKVTGDVDIALEAIFETESHKLTTTYDSNKGKVEITKVQGGSPVHSEDMIPVNTELQIEITAEPSYTIATTTIAGTSPESGASEQHKIFKITMPNSDLNIPIEFTSRDLQVTIVNEQEFTVKAINQQKESDVYINNSSSTSITSENIPAGTTVDFTFTEPEGGKYIKSISIDNKPINLNVLTYKDKAYTLKGIVIDKATTIIVQGDTRKEVTVTITDPDKIFYTGKVKNLIYSVNQTVNKERDITVQYRKNSNDSWLPEGEGFKYTGNYQVRFKVKEGGIYTVKMDKGTVSSETPFETIQNFEIKKAIPKVIAPTVELNTDGTYKFTGGLVYIEDGNEKIEVKGTFKGDKQNETGGVRVSYEITDGEQNSNVTNEISLNLQCSNKGEVAKVFAYGTYKDNMEFKITGSETVYKSGSSLPVNKEQTVEIILTGIDMNLVQTIYQVTSTGSRINPLAEKVGENFAFKIKDKTELYFELVMKQDNRNAIVFNQQKYDDVVKNLIYSGSSQKETIENAIELKIGKENKKDDKVVYTYQKDGQQIIDPIDAGNYSIKIYRPGTVTEKEFNETKAFTIKPKDLAETDVFGIESPTITASEISVGLPLRSSTLTCSQNLKIPGTIKWQDKDLNTIVTKATSFIVEFKPLSSNFNVLQLKNTVEVKVTDKPVLTYSATNGTVEATDAKGKYYSSGSEISTTEKDGITLTFKATPNEGYEFDYFTIIENGKERTEYSNNQSVTIKDLSVDVKAVFKKIGSDSKTHVVTIEQITTRGLVINGYLTHNVKHGKTLTFSVACNPADFNKVRVTVDGNDLQGTSGSYTTDPIKQTTKIRVSLDNPTPFTVNVTTEYKDADGDLLGTVSASGLTDGNKAYYNDQVTLSYTEKNGAKFVKWVGCSENPFIVKSDMSIKAEFEGGDKSTIILPKQGEVKGVSISSYGGQVAEVGKPYTFTVSTYSLEDLKNLVVKVDGNELKPIESTLKATEAHKATYKIEKVTKGMKITMSLSNPTPVKLTINRESKNSKGKIMGLVVATQAAPYYYGDKFTIIASNVDGTKFAYWSDDPHLINPIREYTVLGDDTNKEIVISAIFSGTPVGIEEIEGASVVPGYGHVWVRGIANAQLTMVDLGGRVVNAQAISGDTRIDVPAGIYVIVLENKNNVVRMKVIVR